MAHSTIVAVGGPKPCGTMPETGLIEPVSETAGLRDGRPAHKKLILGILPQAFGPCSAAVVHVAISQPTTSHLIGAGSWSCVQEELPVISVAAQ